MISLHPMDFSKIPRTCSFTLHINLTCNGAKNSVLDLSDFLVSRNAIKKIPVCAHTRICLLSVTVKVAMVEQCLPLERFSGLLPCGKQRSIVMQISCQISQIPHCGDFSFHSSILLPVEHSHSIQKAYHFLFRTIRTNITACENPPGELDLIYSIFESH